MCVERFSADEVTDLFVLFDYAARAWWGYFWASLITLIASSFACMVYAWRAQPLRPTVGDKVVVHYSGYLATSVAASGREAKPFDCSASVNWASLDRSNR